MTLTNPLADMLTILRNAARSKQPEANVKRSNMTLAVLEVLKSERYIFEFKVVEDSGQGMIRVYLKSPAGLKGRATRKINDLQTVSKSGLRRYLGYKDIPLVLNGLGINVLSTSRGVMSGRQARRERIGGEILMNVW